MKQLFKTIIAILLIVTFFVPVEAGAKTNPYRGISKDDIAEIKEAVALKLVPDDFTDSYQKTVTEKQLCQLLLNCIEKYSGKKNTVWRKKVTSASNMVITRQTMAELIYKGANAMGMNADKVYKTFTTYYSINKLDKKFVQNWIKKYGYDGDRTEALTCTYMNFSGTLNEEFVNFTQLTSDAADFVTTFGDAKTSKKVMGLTVDYHFRPQDKATNLEAVLAVHRLYKGMEPKPSYVVLEKVSANTIDKTLLTKPSRLPEVSNQKLPAWKGVSITDKASASDGCLFGNVDRNFHEDKIKFLSEQGFNMVRVMFSFSTLGYPDYPAGKVNSREMDELDRLIEWGIKYNVHINLCMYGQPEMANKWPDEIRTGDLFTNKKKQSNVLSYWKMIAKRYADIPNKYLSFNLMNEPEVESDEIYTEAFTPVVQAIWEESPGRTVIADTDKNWATGEGLAALGAALSYHFYEPNWLCYYGQDFFAKEFPTVTQPAFWPLVYLPSVLNSDRTVLTVEGSFKEGTVGIYVHDADKNNNNRLTILADGEVILEKEVKGGKVNAGNGMASVQKAFTAAVPEGIKKIEFKVNDEATIRLTSINITQDGKTVTAYAHDLYDEDYSARETVLLYSQGQFSNKDKELKVDWDYYYNKTILPKRQIAEKYQVGFMIGEFTPFGELLPKNVLLPYMEMLLGGLKKEGIGWSNGGFLGEMYIAVNYPIEGEYHLKKANGMSFYYNKELLDTYKKYIN